jgi:hypothetical protein
MEKTADGNKRPDVMAKFDLTMSCKTKEYKRLLRSRFVTAGSRQCAAVNDDAGDRPGQLGMTATGADSAGVGGSPGNGDG